MNKRDGLGPLKVRELQFSQAILSGCSPTQAARQVGYGSPKQRGWELSRRPRVRQYLARALELQGINPLFITSRLRAMIDDHEVPADIRVECIKLAVRYLAWQEGKTIEEWVTEPLFSGSRQRRTGLQELLL